MSDVVIVEAVRSPIGRRGGGLSTMHSADLLGTVLQELINRSGIDPNEVGQVIGGCVGQVGMQSFNVARTAWLTAGLPVSAPATTIDSQCGSSQQATNLATSLVASGVVDVAVACGVENMSQVPMGAGLARGHRRVERAAGGIGHQLRVACHPLGGEGGHQHAALALPGIPFGHQYALAKHLLEHLHATLPADELVGMGDQCFAHQIGVHQVPRIFVP